jgi:ubiquinone/menaquinone biosynthesis C-methylase UbiE
MKRFKDVRFAEDKFILDPCCGSRMFWFDKENKNTVYMDNREMDVELCDGRRLSINPDYIGDFRNMPFPDEAFSLVVFDPPHLVNVGEKSWLAQKYGRLDRNTWREDIRRGFNECMRVLKPTGVLVFKWNETDVKLSDILSLIEFSPIFGDKRSKTHWVVFVK